MSRGTVLPGRKKDGVGVVAMEEAGAAPTSYAAAIIEPKLELIEAFILTFNEGKVCDAIVHRLKERANLSRAGLRWPEQERHAFPVEIAFTIGNQVFALEHTGIERFKGHVQPRQR
jgi:hypothetical protein